MCILIYKPADAELSREAMLDFYKRNPDGFGVMYLEDGRVVTHKLIAGPKKIRRLYNRVARGRECALHWRYATHGLNSRANTHPHRVTDSLYLMHNGVLSQFPGELRGESDTAHFTRELARGFADNGLDTHLAPRFKAAMAEIIGWSNRMIFLSPDGGFQIVNENTGLWHDGCWYSNTYAWNAPGAWSAPGAWDDDAVDWTWQNGAWIRGRVAGAPTLCLPDHMTPDDWRTARDDDAAPLATDIGHHLTAEQDVALGDLYAWAQSCDPRLESPDYPIREIARALANTREERESLERFLWSQVDDIRTDLESDAEMEHAA